MFYIYLASKIIFSCTYQGRAKKNVSLTYREWFLDDKLISVIAAYTPFGFLCWRIFYNVPINAFSVRQFLKDDLAQYVNSSSVILADNASVHKKYEALLALQTVSNDRYSFLASYSPRLSSIEAGFANVWNCVQGFENQALLRSEPLTVLHYAFWIYSIYGPRGNQGVSYCI
jgi:hypothetical protein